jgi:carbon-monoxide dehydrogenase medium subunit
MKPAQFIYHRPVTLTESIGLLNELPQDARVIAGGQSLGPLLNLRLAQPPHVVDISRLQELRGATNEGDTQAIGACITHAQIEDGEIPDVTCGLLRRVACAIAYRAVRNRGTIGGSMAHADPAADWLTTMLALDASVELRSATGHRRIRISDFVTGALQTAIQQGELVICVFISRLSRGARWGYAKYAKKPGDFAESMSVAVADRDRGIGRIVLGRRSEPPTLLTRTSEVLKGMDSRASQEKLHAAIEADLKSAKVDAADWTMHRAIVLRAVRSLSA